MKPERLTNEEIMEIRAMSDGRPYGTFKLCKAIEAAVNAKWQAMLAAPHEAKTEAEKTAYAFGWWKAVESVRTEYDAKLAAQPVGKKP